MNKPTPSRLFYVAAFLVAMQSLMGFWRFKPSSHIGFYVAVAASIAIPIGFFMRQAWARGAAMLVAVFGIIGELSRPFNGPTAEGITGVAIALYALVVILLSRKSIRAHFTSTTQRESTDEQA
jgi:hypothetical protein